MPIGSRSPGLLGSDRGIAGKSSLLSYREAAGGRRHTQPDDGGEYAMGHELELDGTFVRKCLHSAVDPSLRFGESDQRGEIRKRFEQLWQGGLHRGRRARRS
ncbi:hypothetical protein D3C74_348940 [compost metagenome]